MIRRFNLLMTLVVVSTIAHASLSGMVRVEKNVGFPEVTRWGRNSLEIMKAMLWDPDTTSALTESSPWVAQKMLARMNRGNVLEIGAGPGWTLTDWVAQECGKDRYFNRFDIVECNPEFYKILQRRYTGLRKVHLYNAFFDEDWMPSRKRNKKVLYDTIIATLPFTRLPNEAIESILKRALELLKPGGKFIYIKLWGSTQYGKVKAFFKSLVDSDSKAPEEYDQKLNIFNSWLKRNFEVEEFLAKRNIPPLWVGIATKQ